MLRNETPQRQHQIIGRVWSAIGIKPEHITDGLLDEWTETLADCEIEDLDRGVHFWKAKGRTCPADEFAESCKPHTSKPLTVQNEIAKMEAMLGSGESDLTFEQHYNRLGLPRRWGQLPKDHPELSQ